jgi:hypothetical protein
MHPEKPDERAVKSAGLMPEEVVYDPCRAV